MKIMTINPTGLNSATT